MLELNSIVVYLLLLPVTLQIILPLCIFLLHGFLQVLNRIGLIGDLRVPLPVLR